MNLELSGKAALVTGASRGIGEGIVRELGEEGADVRLVAFLISPKADFIHGSVIDRDGGQTLAI